MNGNAWNKVPWNKVWSMTMKMILQQQTAQALEISGKAHRTQTGTQVTGQKDMQLL